MTINGRIAALPPGARRLPDDARYTGRFEFVSDSGSRYIIAYDTAINAWCCGCTAGRNRGECKHLRQYRPEGPWRSERMEALRAKEAADRVAVKRAEAMQKALAGASADVIVGRAMPLPPPPIEGTFEVMRSMDIDGTWFNVGERLYVGAGNRDRLRQWVFRLLANGGIRRAQEAGVKPAPRTPLVPPPRLPVKSTVGPVRRKLRGPDEV